MKKIDNFLKNHYRFISLLCIGFVIISSLINYFIYSTIANGDTSVSKNDMSSYIMNEMNSMDARYSYSIGWLMWILSFSAVIVGFYSYQQWKLSRDQKEELKNEINDKFGIKEMQSELRDAKQYNNEMKHLISESQTKIEKLKKDSISFNLDSAAHLVETMDKSDGVVTARNKLALLDNLLIKYKNEKISENTIKSVMICVGNGVRNISNVDFETAEYKTDFYKILNNSKDILLSKFNDKNDKEFINFQQIIDKELKGKIK